MPASIANVLEHYTWDHIIAHHYPPVLAELFAASILRPERLGT